MYHFKLKNNIKIEVSKENFDNWLYSKPNDFITEVRGQSVLYVRKEDIVMGFKLNITDDELSFKQSEEPNEDPVVKILRKLKNLNGNFDNFYDKLEKDKQSLENLNVGKLKDYKPSETFKPENYKGYEMDTMYGSVEILNIFTDIKKIKLEVSYEFYDKHIKDKNIEISNYYKFKYLELHEFYISFENFDKHIDPLISKYKNEKGDK